MYQNDKKPMTEKIGGKSKDVWAEKLEILKKQLPGVISENEVDCQQLKKMVGDENVADEERYQFVWAGKSKAFEQIKVRTTKTLKPNREESVDFDDTENIFIEGENLEVLKVLQKSYYNKIKMIYIDPPYNTGNDFVYNDKFAESRDEYEKKTGDQDEEGNKTKGLRKNTKESGHYHSNWLTMMYPRLYLARNLLKEDGVIFVSIDDNEVHNLRMIMDEIFGEENFEAILPRTTKRAGKTSDLISKNHDYILFYHKGDLKSLNAHPHTDEGYKHSDEHIESRGKYKLSQTLDYDSIQYSSSLDYEINIDGNVFRPGGVSRNEMNERKNRNPSSDYCWRWSKKLFKFGLKNDFIVVKKSKNGKRLYTKTYENAIIEKNIDSKKEFAKLFDKKFFDYTKPSLLIKELAYYSTNSNDIILDFFAGSGTTAQAVMEQNEEDGGNRKYIVVQLPEKTDKDSEVHKAGYKNIADLAKERIRRASKNIKGDIDKGFKVFKLDDSNFNTWRLEKLSNRKELQQKLEDQLKPVDSNDEDLIYELIYKIGASPNSKINKKNDYYLINNGEYLICLAENIDQNLVDKVIKEKPEVAICLDSSFSDDDELKTNTVLQMKSENIEFKVI